MNVLDKKKVESLFDTLLIDHNLSREELDQVLKDAIIIAGRSTYGEGYDFHVEITDKIQLYRKLRILEEIEDHKIEIKKSEINNLMITDKEGEYVLEPLSMDMPRAAISDCLTEMKEGIYRVNREKEFNLYKDRTGTLFLCTITKVVGNTLYLLVNNKNKGIAMPDSWPKRHGYVSGEKRLWLLQAVREGIGPQLFFENKSTDFLYAVLKEFIKEIGETVTVEKIVRDPGRLSKVAVSSSDPSVNPIGTCVGFKGERGKAISQELKGEKVDFVLWKDNIIALIVSCFKNISIKKINQLEDRIEIVVPSDKFASAVGSRGKNVFLTERLIGKRLQIFNEEEYEKREKEKQEAMAKNMMEFGVEENIALSLVMKYPNIYNAERDQDLNELQVQNLKNYLQSLRQLERAEFIEKGGSPDLFVDGVPTSDLFSLLANGIKTVGKLQEYDALSLSQMTKISPDICVLLTQHFKRNK